MNVNQIIGKRVKLENPKEFFGLIKKSPRYVSWNKLIKEVDCGNTTLKRCRKGEITFQGKIFNNLLEYLDETQKKVFLKQAVLLGEHWGSSKGGKMSVCNRKTRLGEKGFLKLMSEIREDDGVSSFSKWHIKMKTENPNVYHNIQRKRWLNLLKIWGNKENRKKAIQSLRKKYGEDYFSCLGLKGASNQPLNKREQLVKARIKKLGFDIKFHKTMFGFNFDFIYEIEGCLKAVEEVLGFKKKKASVFFDILVLYEKFKKLRETSAVPFFVSAWSEVNLNYKIERFPLELLIWAFKKKMTPILMDLNVFDDVRINFLWKMESNSIKYIDFLKCNLKKRKNLLRKGALIQSKQSFDKLEEKVNEILKAKNLMPEGKKLLKTKYNTFIVPDNYFKIKEIEVAVFVSKQDIKGIIGSAALVKELVSMKIRTIGIVAEKSERDLKTTAQNLLLKTYVDNFYVSIEDFNKNFMGP